MAGEEAIAWAVYSTNDSFAAADRQYAPVPALPEKPIGAEDVIDDDLAVRNAREYAGIKRRMREMRRRYVGDTPHFCKSGSGSFRGSGGVVGCCYDQEFPSLVLVLQGVISSVCFMLVLRDGSFSDIHFLGYSSAASTAGRGFDVAGLCLWDSEG